MANDLLSETHDIRDLLRESRTKEQKARRTALERERYHKKKKARKAANEEEGRGTSTRCGTEGFTSQRNQLSIVPSSQKQAGVSTEEGPTTPNNNNNNNTIIVAMIDRSSFPNISAKLTLTIQQAHNAGIASTNHVCQVES